jgi:thioredoxin reductase (NADPH)
MQSKMVIIGSGPAGLTAAIYAARANLEPLVIRGLQPGGLITTTSEVENFPGFPEGVGGFELTENMARQAERFGSRFLDETVLRVDMSRRPFTLVTDSERIVSAETLIISTGASPRKLGVPGEAELANRGVSYCATCDGFFFKGKKVLVIGGGNSALDESLFLTRFVNELVVIHRRDQLRADPILQERAFDNEKISFVWDTVVPEILGDGRVTAVRATNVKTGEQSVIEADGVFIYVGHVPNTALFADYLTTDDEGYIITNGRTRTDVPGVFAAGDVTDPSYRQAITSAGQGCMAAMEAMWFLDEQEHLERKAAQAVV